jgi:signal transduction histidine kinase
MFSAIRPRLNLDGVGARLTCWSFLTLGGSLPEADVFWYEQSERRLVARGRAVPVTSYTIDGGTPHVAALKIDRADLNAPALQSAPPATGLQPVVSHLVTIVATAIALTLIMASYRSRAAGRRALAPVDEIVRQLRRIEVGRLAQRLDIDADSAELERLVTTVNEMLDRIETSWRVTRRFVADVSHELQTPLAAMRAAVEQGATTERGPAECHEMAADLLAEIDRLSALIRDLRTLALADAGHLVAAPERVDLHAITDECCEIARAIAEDRGIRIEIDFPDTLIVLGSPLHLRRAILNLACNAVVYSPECSQVSVAVRHIDGHAIVTVQDRGCGIAPDALLHIFEPFYRADRNEARHPDGLGLGLAIADQIARAHGGRIDVTSAPGEGSTFSLILPLAPPARRALVN